MDTQRWELAGNIFERLLGAPAERRGDMLETLCGADAELKNVVLSMLDSESSALRFEQNVDMQQATATVVTEPLEDGDDGLPPDRRVGPWLLVRKLGSGGMGVVWLAERVDGQFEQRAALKLIKRGMDSDAVLKRFLRERQILARLDHPHIAHLLDGGIAADGRPYFAMEYVEGLPILRYCHERGLDLRARIRLFIQVCGAVHFAHVNHVVHRDLKPSNILVTANAGVRLLDFGIAKLLESDNSGAETLTHLRERPMTPLYAAPEQIRGGRISEATDVYALGCVLYQLLTGQHVHDFSGAADVKDVLRIVETTDPVAPSRLKLNSMPVSRKYLRGDLDTIVLAALKREPARRYASAEAFAADLANYLDGKPIRARGDSMLYRAYKLIRRHRTGLAASVAVAAIAIAAIVFELRPRPPATPMAPGSALAIVDFNNLSQNKEQDAWLVPTLGEMLATELAIGSGVRVLPDELVRPAGAGLAPPRAGGFAPQSLTTLRKRVGADFVLSGNYLVSGSANDARLRLDLVLQDARSGLPVATVAQSGLLADLPALVDRAGMDLRGRLGYTAVSALVKSQVDRAQPPSTEVARHMGSALNALRKAEPARARDELLDAVARAPGYAPAYAYLAQAWSLLGYDAKALAAAENAAAYSAGLPPDQRLRIDRQVAVQKGEWSRAQELDRQLMALDPKNTETRLDAINDLLAGGQLDEADRTLEEVRKLPGSADDPRMELKAVAIAARREDYKAQAEHAKAAWRLAEARDEPALAADAIYDLGLAYRSLRNNAEAEKLMRRSIDEYSRIGNPRFVADAQLTLASMLQDQGQPQAARTEYQNALATFQRIDYKQGIATVYQNLTRLLWSQGDHDAAETAARRSLQISAEIGDAKTQAWNLTAFAIMRLDDAASDAVMEDFRRALALNEAAKAREQHIFALQAYSEGLRLRGELDEAQKICAQAQAEAKQLNQTFSTMIVEFRCAAIALDRGAIDTAIAGLQHAQALAKAAQDAEMTGSSALLLAQIELERHHWPSARDYLQSAIETFKVAESASGEANAQSLMALCSSALNQPGERDSALARARALRSRVTARREVFITDLVLAGQGDGASGFGAAAVALRNLADDADKRGWLANALEARLAALRALRAAHDPAVASLSRQIEASARERGFGWVLARINAP